MIESENYKKQPKEFFPNKESLDIFKEYAFTVSEWTHLYINQMIPRTPEKILSYFEKGHSILLINEADKELVAHAAIKWVSTNNLILEIGTVVVNPKYKGLGYGTEATKVAVEIANKKYPDYLKFAFCNQASLGILKKLGFIEATKEDLPAEVWAGCLSCPNKPKPETGKLCCDTIVVLPK